MTRIDTFVRSGSNEGMDPQPPSPASQSKDITKGDPENERQLADKNRRSLTKTQQEVLGWLSAQVKDITEDGSREKLAEQVLGGNLALAQKEIFIRRFAALHGRLEKLMSVSWWESEKVKVNGELRPDQVAVTDVNGSDDSETVVWLAPSALLSGQTPEALRVNALTLIHELSHSLEPENGFPVKDFAYQDSWAYGLLPPVAVICNADSYRHLAYLIVAEKRDDKWLHAPRGPVPRQRETLHKFGLKNLSNALALANVMLDRAWIRAMDVETFAGMPFNANFDNPLSAWESKKKEVILRNVEGFLRDKGIVGDRAISFVGKQELAENDRAAVRNVYTFLASAKNAMGNMTVTLALSGVISHDKAKRRLTIPYGCLGMAAEPLAVEILGVITDFEARQQEGAKASETSLQNALKYRVDLIFALCKWDRPDLQKQVDDIRSSLLREAFPVPPSPTLDEINTELALAALESCAADWQRNSSEITEGIYYLNPASKTQDALSLSYARACDALKYLDSLPGKVTEVQTKRRLQAGNTIVGCAKLLIEGANIGQLKRPADDALAKLSMLESST
jgi:hypothetical protein